MNGVQHTTGPWKAGQNGRWGVPVYDAEGEHIADVKGFQPTDVREANARLIAAAPDLLAALKDAMRSSRKDFKHGPDGERQHREAYAEQFAAIAKAEGQS